MLQALRERAIARELIDDPVDDARALAETFADMERFNRLFGGVAPARDAIVRLRAGTVLDVGCGTGQIARALARAARRRRFAVTITGLDASDAVVRVARERSRAFPEIRFLAGEGAALPFPARSFDAAICTLALHHCEPPEAVALLAELRRVARHVVVTDLRRSLGGLLGAYCISRGLSRNRLTRHDAPLSVRRAYTCAEATELARAAGWTRPRARPTAFFRLLLRDAA